MGAALGYADDGGDLVRMISKDWEDEFADMDRCVLRGKKLKEFKVLIEPDGNSPFSQHTRHLMLLTESSASRAQFRSPAIWIGSRAAPVYQHAKWRQFFLAAVGRCPTVDRARTGAALDADLRVGREVLHYRPKPIEQLRSAPPPS